MEKFNEKKYWTWKKTLILVVIIFILILIRVFTGPPPPGKNSWSEAFSAYFGNRESSSLPKQIKKHPKETGILENETREAFSSMDPDDINQVDELAQKAINLLPDDEKQRLIALQARFLEYGYANLTEKEIKTMQQLNQKAINLLPEQDRLKLNKIFNKASKEVRRDVEEQFSIQDEHQLKELVDRLDDPDEAVRWNAVVELEKLGPTAKSVVTDIIPYLQSDDWRIRYYVVEILGMIGPGAKLAIPALQKLLDDPDKKVRRRASWALDEISKDN